MPWCVHCDRFLSPPSVQTDGTCPVCGRPVDPGRAHRVGEGVASPVGDAPASSSEELGPAPWHLKLLAGALAVYLGYRFLQGLEWVLHQLR